MNSITDIYLSKNQTRLLEQIAERVGFPFETVGRMLILAGFATTLNLQEQWTSGRTGGHAAGRELSGLIIPALKR